MNLKKGMLGLESVRSNAVVAPHRAKPLGLHSCARRKAAQHAYCLKWMAYPGRANTVVNFSSQSLHITLLGIQGLFYYIGQSKYSSILFWNWVNQEGSNTRNNTYWIRKYRLLPMLQLSSAISFSPLYYSIYGLTHFTCIRDYAHNESQEINVFLSI